MYSGSENPGRIWPWKTGPGEERLVHLLRQCVWTNGSLPSPDGLGLKEHGIYWTFRMWSQLRQKKAKKKTVRSYQDMIMQFWIFSASENGLSVILELSQCWLFHHCKWDFGSLPWYLVVSVIFCTFLEVIWVYFLLTQVIFPLLSL